MNLAAYNKAIVALAMALIGIVNVVFNQNWIVDEAAVTAAVSLLTPVLVYLVPNKG